MIRAGELRIHYKDIPLRIKAHFGDRIKDQHELDHWDFDLRNQTLLHRDAAGYYEFAHKSLAEYFVALKFTAEIGCLAPVFSKTYVEQQGKGCKFPIVETVDWDKLSQTFGHNTLLAGNMTAVRQLLIGMLSMSPQSEEKLSRLVYGTRTRSSIKASLIGGNAFNLLRHFRSSFRGINLSRTRLTLADFQRLDLSHANLSEAKIVDCSLDNANLSGAILDLAFISPIDDIILELKCMKTHAGKADLRPAVLEVFQRGGAILSEVQEKELAQFKARQKSTKR